jgi:inhibitor of cysteine peptidase
VEVRVGHVIEITLAGNPTTGYRWEVADPANGVLEQIGEPQYAADSDALGAGGKFTFRFRAVAKGRAALRLVYHRPFEKSAPPEETFTVTIVVAE